VLKRPELAEDPRFRGNAQRVANRDEVRRLIVEAFETLTAAQAIERIEDAQIANAQVNDMHAVWVHPQLRARDRWREVETAAGTIPALLPPGSWADGPPRMDAVPALGQHTDAILAALGYAADAIDALRAAQAI
jgi:itaconate CoA-transferase